jgi:uncharacterized protein DUF2442
MATTALNVRDRDRFARARALGDAHAADPSAVVEASYDSGRDAFNLTFRSGGSMAIPRRMVPGLDRATTAVLQSVSISPAGDALSWRSVDVDVYVPGLVVRTFGTRLLAAASGRRGGRRKSKAKAAAARANGAKGGRPRKRLRP